MPGQKQNLDVLYCDDPSGVRIPSTTWYSQLYRVGWRKTICFDFTNKHHVFVGKFSAKPHGRFRDHIWIK